MLCFLFGYQNLFKMEIQDYLTSLVQQARNKRFADSPQLSLGELINEIEKCGIQKNDGGDKEVCYDFGTAIPTDLDSYRGSYNELALGYKLTGYDNDAEHLKDVKAKDLLQHLKEAIGKEYTGWKGGEYTMSKDTPLWVANSGNAGSTAILGVLDDGWRLILLTAYVQF
jgi:hypothetical protein